MDLRGFFNRLREDKENQKFLQKFGKVHFWRYLGWLVFRAILFTALIYVMIYPLIYIITSSIKPFRDMLDPTCIWVARHPTLYNYKLAFRVMDYLRALKNSCFVSFICALIQVASCSVIGYGFARFEFKEKKFLFGLVILSMIVPVQTILIPQYLYFGRFDFFYLLSFIKGGINLANFVYWIFIMPALFGLGLRGGLFIFIFRQFFRGMPKELEDSSYIDGCGPFHTFCRIMIPNAIPAIVTVFLFSFVWHWNDVFEPTIYLNTPESSTLAMKLVNLRTLVTPAGSVNVDVLRLIPPQNAGVMLVLVPMLILYAIGQRYFVESVERSGIVG
ncbi:MAG: carbohydrate ABC transporter permease [Bacillota bacterium]